MLIQKIMFLGSSEQTYPYHLPIFDQEILFNRDVTILVGDNGTGKSTVLELIASKLNVYRIGTSYQTLPKVTVDVQYHLQRPKGFYFSAEDFTTYIHEQENEKNEANAELMRIQNEYQHRSNFAKNQASMPHHRSLSELNHLHDRNLFQSSHGEAYLSFFKSRIRPNQVMLLDEPETPLSFSNQLALLILINDAVKQGCQIIMATHSPIVMSFPNAQIIEFSHQGLQPKTLDQIESFQSMKQFINNPNSFLRHLFAENESHESF